MVESVEDDVAARMGRMGTPESLIERWLPFAEIGAESQRERGASSALPPLYFLHVWWARRPLTVSRAAVLASALPVWSEDWPPALRERFPSETSYQVWFTRLLGIVGDPVGARKLIDRANHDGVKLQGNPYGYARAFTVGPSEQDFELLLQMLELRWGTREVTVLDPMAGGGSVPFEALRYGFTTVANELNPVASTILVGTLDYPVRFGPNLTAEIRRWGLLLAERVQERLKAFFPRPHAENIHAYLWARTITCPVTGKPFPCAPNWWLRKGREPAAVQVLTHPAWPECRFQILNGREAIEGDPDKGTIRRGIAVSPWTGEVVDGEYIKREAQAGRMGQQLYAVALKTDKGLTFRSPTDADLAAARSAEEELARNIVDWDAQGWIPREPRQAGRADWAAEVYGFRSWADTFAPRQLLAFCTAMSELQRVKSEINTIQDRSRASALITYLCLAFDKAVDYNSTQVIWDPTRQKIAHAFQRHDFSMKWTFAEFDAAHNLFHWAATQISDSYLGISRLTQSTQLPLWLKTAESPVERLRITQGNAAQLDSLQTGSVHVICVDPPYYDNVQYAELSDYFYVWLKRTGGEQHSGWFNTELTDKDDEAVANEARFAAFGSKRKSLARQDYERKMLAIFSEAGRVLQSDGILTVMFTHKQVQAWDTLATALISAGFRIDASWPVHTESEHSLHQARKNAAASTILLVCRKREVQSEPIWWDDIRGEVQRVARERAAEFAEHGITGVDLYISVFGPALSVISERWPVLTSEVDQKTGQPKPIRPEVALDLAREEVINLRKEGLLLGRQVQFDASTDWYLMAWDAFKAAEFPADEARKLALALGLDLEQDIVRRERLVAKKASTVVIQTPAERRRNDVVDPEATTFPSLIDTVHTSMLVYEEDGSHACEQFLKRTGLLNDGTFKACLQALINAIPRTKLKDHFARPEAKTLENLRLAFFEDLTVPAEETPPEVMQQSALWSSNGQEALDGIEKDVDGDEA